MKTFKKPLKYLILSKTRFRITMKLNCPFKNCQDFILSGIDKNLLEEKLAQQLFEYGNINNLWKK